MIWDNMTLRKIVTSATIAGLLVILLLTMLVLCTGCVDQAKTATLDAIAPVVVLKGSTQYERMQEANAEPTPAESITPVISVDNTSASLSVIMVQTEELPLETVTTLPTLSQHFVDPYLPGERWERQWFKFQRSNASGLKNVDGGIVVYRHAYMDKYTWWNNAMGNYFEEYAPPGTRFCSVWIHEELFGDNIDDSATIWAFDNTSFELQYRNRFVPRDTQYIAVNRIKEFDNQHDYYDIANTPPFGWTWVYTGQSPSTAGWEAQKIGYLHMGQGNAIDGYIIFLVPQIATDNDLLLVGNFAAFGQAYWRFGNEGTTYNYGSSVIRNQETPKERTGA